MRRSLWRTSRKTSAANYTGRDDLRNQAIERFDPSERIRSVRGTGSAGAWRSATSIPDGSPEAPWDALGRTRHGRGQVNGHSPPLRLARGIGIAGNGLLGAGSAVDGRILGRRGWPSPVRFQTVHTEFGHLAGCLAPWEHQTAQEWGKRPDPRAANAWGMLGER
jgi:hypothetical protein